MKRVFFSAITCVLLMHAMLTAQPSLPQASGLTFFKNYFVTGNYVVGGVNLRGTGVNGTAKGTIDLTNLEPHTPPQEIQEIPSGVDIVAAFLYWETVQTANSGFGNSVATFRGLTNPSDPTSFDHAPYDIAPIAKVLNPLGTAPCWSSGGGTGGADGAHQMFLYRADVLRYIPIDPVTKKRLVKTKYEIQLPDSGSGNSVPSTAGASLVVIYKDPTKPLRSIVIYNGGYTMDNSTQLMNRTISGFYDAGVSPAATAGLKAQMTHIVGDGSAAKSEVLYIGSGDSASISVADNPFQGSVTPSVDPAWDNYTFDVSAVLAASPHSSAVTTRVDHTTNPFDCLSWGAIIFSTTVQDSDNDGLLDAWELPHDPSKPLQWTDPNGVPLPDLYGMGARMNQKDIFVEIGAMKADDATLESNPSQAFVAHDHMPSKIALDMVAKAFRNAPTAPNGPGPINIHFDVGKDNIGATKRFPTPPSASSCWDSSTWNANCAIVPADLSKGGESIPEKDVKCVETATHPCLFESYPGTVGWKTGFRVLRDKPLNYPDESSCSSAADCVRRFDHNRKDIFHYALFAHAIGLQRLDAGGNPIVDATGSFIPRNVSGTADGGGSGGGDLMITLGFWDNSVGTDFMQASTLMHELGHNFGLRHGGGPPIPITGGFKPQPNCKPNYESVMSYLFQVGGLLCDSASALLTPQCVGRPAGDAVIDYSRQVLGGASGLNETALTEQPPSGLSGGMIYRTRWFSRTSDLDTLLGTPPASRYCDGTRIPTDGSGNPVETGFRLDGTSLTAVDWNGDLAIATNPPVVYHQNANFIGGPKDASDTTTDGPFKGFNDWLNIDLRQVGSRRNVASLGGPLSLDQGQGDNGQGDNGQGDNGQGDNGQGDNGQGDNGQGDNGQGDNGQGDNGVDADLDATRAWGNAVTLLTPAVTKQTIVLTWTPPHVDVTHVTYYYVYRVTGTAVTHPTLVSKVLVSGNPVGNPPLPAPTTVVDADVKNNTTYTYWVQAKLDINNKGEACGTAQSCLSGVSNFQTVVKK